MTPSIGDVVLVGGGLAAVWGWLLKRRQRKARERERFALRDESLMCLTAALAQALRLMSGRPCMIGEQCQDESTGAREATAQVAVLIDRLDSLHTRMQALMEAR